VKLITKSNPSITSNQGFTMTELLIAMCISGFIVSAVYMTYRSQQQSYIVQEDVAIMQQNLRAAAYHMAHDIRSAGYDQENSGLFGITIVQDYDIDSFTLDVNGDGHNIIEFTADLSDDGVVDSNETISFCLFDPDGDEKLDLARRVSGIRRLLAENIEALGFAYAYDDDGNGQLDPLPEGGNNVIWAIDSDNDNFLDLNLDTDNNGIIDQHDDTNDDGSIDGVALASTVDINKIRAVRIWILARADKPDKNFSTDRRYAVGGKVITPTGAERQFRRKILTTTVNCRNMGL